MAVPQPSGRLDGVASGRPQIHEDDVGSEPFHRVDRFGAVPTTSILGSRPGTSASPILGLTYLPVVLFSGGLGMASGQPRWIGTPMPYLPIPPVIDAATHGLSDSSVPVRDPLVLGCWLVAGIAVAVAAFRWQPARPRRSN